MISLFSQALEYTCPECGEVGDCTGGKMHVPRLHLASADIEIIAKTVEVMSCDSTRRFIKKDVVARRQTRLKRN